jgi:transcriptional regulator with XRE-family HTH domain
MYVFAELLRGFRSREQVSQQGLADSIGVRRSTISNWENGVYLPRKMDHVIKIAQVLNLFPEDTKKLLAAADPDNRHSRNWVDRTDDLVNIINLNSGAIKIYRDDISSTIQLIRDLHASSRSQVLSRSQIEEIARAFKLTERRKTNGHLRYNDGDISFWYEQVVSLDELTLQFGARKVVLGAADKSGVRIEDQGTLSWVATRVMSLLRRSTDDSILHNSG